MTVDRTNIVSFEKLGKSLANALERRELPRGEVADAIIALQEKYKYVIQMMDHYIPEGAETDDSKIELALYTFVDHGGNQILAEGSVSDLRRPVQNQYNCHLQNTSQWLFAFGLLFDVERQDFSVHT